MCVRVGMRTVCPCGRVCVRLNGGRLMLFMTSRVISKGSRRGWMMDWGAEGASRWVSRESEVKCQLDVADLSRSRVAGLHVQWEKKIGSREQKRKSTILI